MWYCFCDTQMPILLIDCVLLYPQITDWTPQKISYCYYSILLETSVLMDTHNVLMNILLQLITEVLNYTLFEFFNSVDTVLVMCTLLGVF